MRRRPLGMDWPIKAALVGAAVALAALGAWGGSAVRGALTAEPQELFQKGPDDPPLGIRVDLPAEDVFGQKLELSEGRILVVAGNMVVATPQNWTNYVRVDYEALPYERFDRVVVLYELPAPVVRNYATWRRSEAHRKLSVAADPEGVIASKLNAWDVGRWAVVRDGKLTELQENSDHDPY